MNIERVGLELGAFLHHYAGIQAVQEGFYWRAVPMTGAPSTLSEMRAEAIRCNATGRPYRVSGEQCEGSVYGRPHYNVAFRFLHDMLHLNHNLDTSLEAELKVGALHVEHIKGMGFSTEHQLLMWVDTCGQTLYNYLTGSFPVDQMSFAQQTVLRINEHRQSPEQAVRSIANQGAI